MTFFLFKKKKKKKKINNYWMCCPNGKLLLSECIQHERSIWFFFFKSSSFFQKTRKKKTFSEKKRPWRFERSVYSLMPCNMRILIIFFHLKVKALFKNLEANPIVFEWIPSYFYILFTFGINYYSNMYVWIDLKSNSMFERNK